MSGSDGIDWFYLHAFPAPLRLRWGSQERRLAMEVENLAHEVYTEANVQRIRSEVVFAGRAHGRPSVNVLVEGDGHLEPLRMAVHGTATDGRIVTLWLMTSATLPTADMVAELAAVARTLRPISSLPLPG